MASLVENTERIVNAIKDIKAAIIRKGVTPTGKCETFADAIDDIFVGVDVSDTTASRLTVLEGFDFYNKFGNKVSGEVPRITSEAIVITGNSPKYMIPNGYHNGSGSVEVSLQSKNVTPTASDQTILPDTGKVLGVVTVDGVPVQIKSVTPSSSVQTVYPDAGYFLSSVIVGAAKVRTGTFTSTTSGYTVNCGFPPKMVFVTNNYNATTYNELDAWINGTFSGARGAGANSGGNILTPTITVSDNTFTHKAFNANFANKPAYYVVVG